MSGDPIKNQTALNGNATGATSNITAGESISSSESAGQSISENQISVEVTETDVFEFETNPQSLVDQKKQTSIIKKAAEIHGVTPAEYIKKFEDPKVDIKKSVKKAFEELDNLKTSAQESGIYFDVSKFENELAQIATEIENGDNAPFVKAPEEKLSALISKISAANLYITTYDKEIGSSQNFAETKFASNSKNALEKVLSTINNEVLLSTKLINKHQNIFSEYILKAELFNNTKASFDRLPADLKSSSLFEESSAKLAKIYTKIREDNCNTSEVYAASQDIASRLFSLWHGLLKSNDSKTNDILTTLSSPKFGFDQQTGLDLIYIQKSLNGETGFPLDLNLLSKYAGTLIAANHLVNTINPEGLKELKQLNNPRSRALNALNILQNIFQNDNLPDSVKSNPEVVLALFTKEGILDPKSWDSINGHSLKTTIVDFGKLMKEGKISSDEGRKKINLALTNAAAQIGAEHKANILKQIHSILIMDHIAFEKQFEKSQKVSALADGTFYKSFITATKNDTSTVDNDNDGNCDEEFNEDQMQSNNELAKLSSKLDADRKKLIAALETKYDTTPIFKALTISKEDYVHDKLIEYFSTHLDEYKIPEVIYAADGVEISTKGYFAEGWGNEYAKYVNHEKPGLEKALKTVYEKIRPGFVQTLSKLETADNFKNLIENEYAVAKMLTEGDNSIEAVLTAAVVVREENKGIELNKYFKSDEAKLGFVKLYAMSENVSNREFSTSRIGEHSTLEEIKEANVDVAKQLKNLQTIMGIEEASFKIGMFYLQLGMIAGAAWLSGLVVTKLGIEGALSSYLVDATVFNLADQGAWAAINQKLPTLDDFAKKSIHNYVTLGVVRGAAGLGKLTGYYAKDGAALLNDAKALENILNKGTQLSKLKGAEKAAVIKAYRGLAASFGGYNTVLSGLTDDALKLAGSYTLLHAGSVGSGALGINEMPESFFDLESALTLLIIHGRGKMQEHGKPWLKKSIKVEARPRLKALKSFYESLGYHTAEVKNGFDILEPFTAKNGSTKFRVAQKFRIEKPLGKGVAQKINKIADQSKQIQKKIGDFVGSKPWLVQLGNVLNAHAAEAGALIMTAGAAILSGQFSATNAGVKSAGLLGIFFGKRMANAPDSGSGGGNGGKVNHQDASPNNPVLQPSLASQPMIKSAEIDIADFIKESSDILLIGREKFGLDHPTVSRKHLLIENSEGKIQISNIGTNLITIDSNPLNPKQDITLAPGNHVIEFPSAGKYIVIKVPAIQNKKYTSTEIVMALESHGSFESIPNSGTNAGLRDAAIEFAKKLADAEGLLSNYLKSRRDHCADLGNVKEINQFGINMQIYIKSRNFILNLIDRFCPGLSISEGLIKLNEINAKIQATKTPQELIDILNSLGTKEATFLSEKVYLAMLMVPGSKTDILPWELGIREKVEAFIDVKLEPYIGGSSGIPEVIKNLKGSSEKDMQLLGKRLDDLLSGNGNYKLGEFPGKIKDLFVQELEAAKNEITYFEDLSGQLPRNSSNEAFIKDPYYNDILQDYRSLQLIRQHAKNIENARHFLELIDAVKNLPFNTIVNYKNNVPVKIPKGELVDKLMDIFRGRGAIQEIPEALGIRAKAKLFWESERHDITGRLSMDELAEQKTYSRLKDDLFETVNKLIQKFTNKEGKIGGSKKEYTPEEMIQLINDVIDGKKHPNFIPAPFRGEVEVYMKEFLGNARADFPEIETYIKDGVNPFNGRKISNDREDYHTRYEIAIQVVRKNAGLPVFQPVTESEMEETLALAKKYFPYQPEEKMEASYNNARKAIKNILLDETNPFGDIFWQRSTPEDRRIAVESVFGNFTHIELNTNGTTLAGAKNFVEQLAKYGCYREVGLTLSYNGEKPVYKLSLGELGYVHGDEGNKFYIAHSHPQHFKKPEFTNGSYYDHTIALDIPLLIDDLKYNSANIFPSYNPNDKKGDGGDVLVIMKNAEKYFGQRHSWKSADNEFFADGSFHHLVFSPMGISAMKYIKGDSTTKPQMTISFVVYDGVKFDEAEATNTMRHLMAFGKKYDVEVKFHRFTDLGKFKKEHVFYFGPTK